jgi:L-ascorbate metabolism protein UlaG (beta-lactamase superfamily)
VSPRVTWLGHATAVIALEGLCVITDPVLRGRLIHLRRHTPVPDPPGDLDAVLVSHLHYDHADSRSLRRLAAGLPVLAPAGSGPRLRRMCSHEIVELAPGERVPVAGGSVLAVPADHDGRRSPLHGRSGAVGFVAEADGLRVYFAGDTAIYPGMADLGPLDVALVPIWGWGPKLGPGHMDPEQAAQAVALLSPRVAVPIHWATYLPFGYARHHRMLRDPGARFVAAATRLAPDVDVRLVAPGATVDFV